MSSNLTAGQSFPTHYRLDRQASNSGAVQTWIATHEHTGDRAFVHVLLQVHDPASWSDLTLAVDAIRGLVHPNINRVREHGHAEGRYYLIEPYVAAAKPFSPAEGDPWPVLRQLIDALQYIHTLGIAHGNLHPGNLLVDTAGTLHVTGTGIGPDWTLHDGKVDFRSPQLSDQTNATPSDDIYSLGCLIYSALSRQPWKKERSPDAPLPASLSPMVTAMMSESPYDRTVDLAAVKEALASHYGAGANQIAAADFRPTRVATEPTKKSVNTAGGMPKTRQQEGVPTAKVMLAGAAILVVAAALFMLLPGAEQPSPALPNAVAPAQNDSASGSDTTAGGGATTPAAAPEIASPLEKARLEAMQQQGETIVRDILKTQLALEDHGVSLWAATEYQSITAALETADALFRGGDFEAALAGFQHIQRQLAELDARQPAIFEEQLALGKAELEQGEQQAALEALTIAQAIQPDNETIAQLLRRAENLDQVLALMRRGEAQERDQALDEALAQYREARALDADWLAAGQAVSRVQSAITRRSFQTTMSQAFSAMRAKSWKEARELFQTAQRIMPDSTEPADGLAQVDQAETGQQITSLRQEAEANVAVRDWEAAISSYEAILTISDSLEFARQGLERTLARQAIDNRLQRYLADPPLLQDDQELRAASALLKDAAGTGDTDSNFLRRVDTLARLISTARIEIPVTIVSDGRTLVTVRKHAELGQIESEVVYLVPGRYTVTGVREGYRDVREELVLIAGRPVPALTIASTERVR